MGFFKPKIQTKLIMAFLIMGFIPMILSTLIVVKINWRREDSRIKERIAEASRKAMELIRDYQSRASQQAKLSIEDPEFRKKYKLEELSEIKPIVRPGMGKPTVIWVPGRIAEMDYQKEDGETTQVIHLIEVFESKSLAASSILPVRSHGRIIGNLIVAFLLERHFTEHLENMTGVNMVRIDPEPFLTERRALDDIHFTDRIKEKVLKEKKDYYEERALLRGEPYKALYKPLLGLDGNVTGVIFFGVPRKHTFESVVGAKSFWIWLILFGIFMAAALGYTMARRISRRINLFAEAARLVADGNLDQEIRVKSKDEIGELSSAFNLMTGRLRQMRELEEELRRKDRLAALGELSAGVAHEVRNPLGIIKNSAQVLQDKFKDKDTKSRELSKFIIEEVDRLNKVVTNFLDFARPQKPNLTGRKIAPIISRALELMQSEILKRKIKVANKHEDNLPPVLADEELLAQVFLNIISNAIQAMPDGGRLMVSSKSGAGSYKDLVEISFTDTGCGIPAQDLDKIFNPFFSNKEGGVGLGLSIVHKIVESHGGKISVHSRVGEGTTFTIHLKGNLCQLKS
ncbi:HAMP domain-containing protein [bacterium]|nr:HAMP domain-containing protein [bacterium]